MSQVTKLANLINPEVMGDFINKKLTDAIKFAPLAVIGNELNGQAGDTITMPVWKYIGDAQDLAEGVEGDISQLSATSTKVKVKKAVKNVAITDEAVVSGLGDVVGQAELQLVQSIANKIDNDSLTALKGVSELTHEAEAFNSDFIADALTLFGEDVEEASVCMINAKNYAILRKDPAFVHVANGAVFMSGHVGNIYGCNVVVSNKIADTEVFIVRHGALGIEIKRELNLETERQVLKKQTIISVDKHFACYLRDASKAIKGTITGGAGLSAKGKKGAKVEE